MKKQVLFCIGLSVGVFCNAQVATINLDLPEACIETSLGVEDASVSDLNFTLYPNPSNGLVNIQLPISLNRKIGVKVYNALGQVVHIEDELQPLERGLYRLNLRSLINGVYLVSIKTGERVITQKLIIKK